MSFSEILHGSVIYKSDENNNNVYTILGFGKIATDEVIILQLENLPDPKFVFSEKELVKYENNTSNDGMKEFKPFDKVLVREDYNTQWIPAVFQLYQETGIRHYYASGNWYLQCIPYKGNEHLVGTTNEPKNQK